MAAAKGSHRRQQQQQALPPVGTRRLLRRYPTPDWRAEASKNSDHGKGATGQGRQAVEAGQQGAVATGVEPQRHDSEQRQAAGQGP